MPADPVTVLFTSAGRRVELLSLFRADGAALGVPIRIAAADTTPALSAACQVADTQHAVRPFTQEGFVDEIFALCQREHVALVVPLQDAELELFASARERFAAAGVHVVVSSLEVIRTARNKLATARAFAAGGIPVPRTAPLAEVLADATGWTWPLIAKPISGGASVGVCVLPDARALTTFAGQIDRDGYLLQEKITGPEFTVNVFADRAGTVRCAVPHVRLEVRAGEVSKGRTERQPALTAIAQALGRVLPGAYGPLCFQAIVMSTGEVRVFEINARFGGGFPLAHRAGAHVPRWLLEDALGRPSSARDEWRPGVLMLRHDVSIFRD